MKQNFFELFWLAYAREEGHGFYLSKPIINVEIDIRRFVS